MVVCTDPKRKASREPLGRPGIQSPFGEAGVVAQHYSIGIKMQIGQLNRATWIRHNIINLFVRLQCASLKDISLHLIN